MQNNVQMIAPQMNQAMQANMMAQQQQQMS